MVTLKNNNLNQADGLKFSCATVSHKILNVQMVFMSFFMLFMSISCFVTFSWKIMQPWISVQEWLEKNRNVGGTEAKNEGGENKSNHSPGWSSSLSLTSGCHVCVCVWCVSVCVHACVCVCTDYPVFVCPVSLLTTLALSLSLSLKHHHMNDDTRRPVPVTSFRSEKVIH